MSITIPTHVGGVLVRRSTSDRIPSSPSTHIIRQRVQSSDDLLVASYWPVFKDTDLRNRYNLDILTRRGVSKIFVASLWAFLATACCLVGIVSTSGLRGKFGSLFQLWTVHALWMAFSQLLLTVHVLMGDERVAKSLTSVGIESPHATFRLREALTLNYLYNNNLSLTVSHLLRTISEECTLDTPMTELQYCNQVATPGISPICLDNLLFYVLFLVIYQLTFPQLKWDHFAISWLIGLSFLVAICALAIGRGRLPVQSVPQTVLYMGVYFGTYMVMCILHKSKLQSYLNNTRLSPEAWVERGARRQQMTDRTSDVSSGSRSSSSGSESSYSSLRLNSSSSSASIASDNREILVRATYDFRV
jgi:hypothetical protein